MNYSFGDAKNPWLNQSMLLASAQIRVGLSSRMDRFILCYDRSFWPNQSVLISLARSLNDRFNSSLCYHGPFWPNQFINCSTSPCIPSSKVRFGSSSTCPFRSAWWELSNGHCHSPNPRSNRKWTDLIHRLIRCFQLMSPSGCQNLEPDLRDTYVHFDEVYLLVVFFLHFHSIFHLVKASFYIFMLKLAPAKCECQHYHRNKLRKLKCRDFLIYFLFVQWKVASLHLVFVTDHAICIIRIWKLISLSLPKKWNTCHWRQNDHRNTESC